MSAAREYMYETLRHEGWTANESELSKSTRLRESEYVVPSRLRFPLHQFVSENKVLFSNKPVEVSVIFENNQIIASNESLSIFAVGDDMDSVMNDFSQHVFYYFNYYRNVGEVIGDAVRLKDIYENNFNLI